MNSTKDNTRIRISEPFSGFDELVEHVDQLTDDVTVASSSVLHLLEGFSPQARPDIIAAHMLHLTIATEELAECLEQYASALAELPLPTAWIDLQPLHARHGAFLLEAAHGQATLDNAARQDPNLALFRPLAHALDLMRIHNVDLATPLLDAISSAVSHLRAIENLKPKRARLDQLAESCLQLYQKENQRTLSRTLRRLKKSPTPALQLAEQYLDNPLVQAYQKKPDLAPLLLSCHKKRHFVLTDLPPLFDYILLSDQLEDDPATPPADPSGLTPRQAAIMHRAEEEGLQTQANGRYDWLETRSLQEYFLGLLFCGDTVKRAGDVDLWKAGPEPFPRKLAEQLYGTPGLGSYRSKQLNKQSTPPKGHQRIDALLKSK